MIGGLWRPQGYDEAARCIEKDDAAGLWRVVDKHPHLLDYEGDWHDLHFSMRVVALLGIAIDKNREAIAVSLIKEGASLRGAHFHPYIEMAVRGMTAGIRALSARDPDVNVTDTQGYTPLHFAKDSATAELLIELGADIEAERQRFHDTPLLKQAARGEEGTDVCKTLLLHGADPNAKDSDGDTSISVALRGGYADKERVELRQNHRIMELLEALRQAGARFDLTNDWGETPLFWNAFGVGEATAFIVKQHCPLDIVSEDGETALLRAVRRRLWQQAEVLVAAGAACYIKDKQGKTVMDLMQEEGGAPETLLQAVQFNMQRQTAKRAQQLPTQPTGRRPMGAKL